MNSGGSIVKLSEFLCSPPGRYVLEWEHAQLNAAVADIFGYHAMQLGLPEIDALRENRMPLRFCAADRQLTVDAGDDGKRRVAVINRYEELPFATHSIDLVVMPHILEFAAVRTGATRSRARCSCRKATSSSQDSILRACGVRSSPLAWGHRHSCRAKGRFIALPPREGLAQALSFEFARGRFGCYAPSARTAAWLHRWRFMGKPAIDGGQCSVPSIC
jgi:hypothetical protein